MGILDGLMALAKDTPAGLVTSTVATVLDHILPEDPAAREAAALKVMELQAQGTFDQRADLTLATAQIDVNKAAEQAGGPHFRDGAGWVCVIGFAFAVARPVVEWGLIVAGHPMHLPAMDMTEIGPMLAALLGLGGMHVYQQRGST
jgi:hypothetical protein